MLAQIMARGVLAGALLIMPAIAAEPARYTGTVASVTDGDSLKVRVPAFAATPWAVVAVRVAGIDTPEVRQPPAKCAAEVVRGKAASAYAKTLLHVGDPVVIVFKSLDKYNRLDGDLLLSDGRSYGTLMLASGLAVPYSGGTKSSFCGSK